MAAEENDERQDSLNLDIPSTPPQGEFLGPILLAFENTRPVEHWLHDTASYKNALEALRNEPWRDVLEERFAPMVRGAPREWRRMVKDDAIFNWGNLVIFARKQYEGEEEMETDGEDEEMDGENETAEREQAHREPWTWRLDVIPQTPGIDHPVWQDHVSFADIGTLLYIQGNTPLQHWLHHTARFTEAFEVLTLSPMQHESYDEFTPTVRGARVAWTASVRGAFLFNWWNHIEFVPRDPDNMRVSQWSREESESLDRWLDNEVGRIQRSRDQAAAVRFAAVAGSNDALPTRGFVSWSPTGSASEAEAASTEAASDQDEDV